MASVTRPGAASDALPDHKQLPETDGTFVENFQEHPQGMLLTDSIRPVLLSIHPDEQFCIGHDSGIYWRLTDSPLDGAKSPDWYYVPNVPPMLDGEFRRSYVLWQEHIVPPLLLEFVSGDGRAERDQTPLTGKFWVYEQGIRAPYYGIFDFNQDQLEVHRLRGGRYQRMRPNERGHYRIPPLRAELGVWHGVYLGMEAWWLRWWDLQGNLLPHAKELAEQERQRAEQERQRADRLAERLRQLGVEPEE